jgi:8-oxo-dGTP pyrophosphatase MutT (NUDIX family)/phosphohistidine phosphatase SixA
MKKDTVYAAGAVLWKVVDKQLKILVVHRTQHKDVSIPKGKVDSGETLPETAVREIKEETGLSVALGPYLGTVEYTLPGNGKPKEVHYWAAEVDPTAAERTPFRSNKEIRALEWMTISTARKKLSYTHDVGLVEALDKLHAQHFAHTVPLIVVRHGKAVPATSWDGPDAHRPLLHRGQAQAKSIAGGIAAYKPAKIYTSTATRCIQTVMPLVGLTGMALKESPKLSQEKWSPSGELVERFVGRRFEDQTAVVMCSHGPVIPQIVAEIVSHTRADVDDVIRRAASPATGDFSVFHVAFLKSGPHLVSVEYHDAP